MKNILIFVVFLLLVGSVSAEVIISNVVGSKPTDTTGLITWTTNIPTNTTIKYTRYTGGTLTGPYAVYTHTNTTYATSHSAYITGLNDYRSYNFNITAYNTSIDFDVESGLMEHFPRETWDYYRTPAQINTTMQSFINEHPTEVQRVIIGRTYNNQTIYAYLIGNSSKGSFMFDGRIHGWEDCGTENGINFINWTLNNGSVDAERVRNNNFLIFIPFINGDSDSRTTMRRSYTYDNGTTINITYGVDVNRNMPVGWGSSGSGDPTSSYDYRGPVVCSEYECQALIVALANYTPDAYMNVHCGMKLLQYNNNINTTLKNTIQSYLVNISSQYGTNTISRYGVGTSTTGLGQASATGANYTANGMYNGWIHETALESELPGTKESYATDIYPEAFPIYLAMAKAVETLDEEPVTNVSISSVSYSATNSTSITISWITNLNTNTTIKYGTTTSLSSSTTNTSFSTSHSHRINGLTPNTLYYFNITGYNTSSLFNTSGVYSTTTLPAEQTLTTINYYFSNSGSDSNSGNSSHPLKTITKHNSISQLPGNTYYFKCGDIWRGPTDAFPVLTGDGNSSHYITYTRYGECTGNNNPRFYGSREASNTSDWSRVGLTNIWKSTSNYTEVANIIFNNGSHAGGYKTNYGSYSNMTIQGDFFWNITDGYLYMYSSSNPATYYTNIELATNDIFFYLNNEDYYNITGLDIRYVGGGGVAADYNVDYMHLHNNTFSWCGGKWRDDEKTRYGDCIGAGPASNHLQITYNNVSDSVDACITTQSWSTTPTEGVLNNNISYNIMQNCPYGMVVFSRYAPVINLTIDHNTFNRIGNGYANWSDVDGRRGIRFGNISSGSSNIVVTNNIFSKYQTLGIDLGDSEYATYRGGPIVFNYNLYDGLTQYIVSYNRSARTTNTVTFCSVDSQECDGYTGEVIFFNDSLQLASNSSGCNLSSTNSYVGALECSIYPDAYSNLTSSCVKKKGIVCTDVCRFEYLQLYTCIEQPINGIVANGSYRIGTITCTIGGCS